MSDVATLDNVKAWLDELIWYRRLLKRLRQERTAIVMREAVSDSELRRAVVAGRSFVDTSGVYIVTEVTADTLLARVAALNEAGFAGLPYPEARENVGTLLDRTNRAEAEVARLREVLRPLYDHVMNASPTGWAGASDLAGAAEWERQVEPMLRAVRAAIEPQEES